MLVLTRRVNEEIVISDLIRVVVIEAKHGRCKLGIIAPDNIRIQRAELVAPPTPPTNNNGDGEIKIHL